MSDKSGAPPLADMVLAGEGAPPAAAAINDHIFMATDISNAYLITTSDGDVLVNTGFPSSAERNKAAFAPQRSGPMRYIILTQSHPDHFGGVETLSDADTKIVAEKRFRDTCKFYKELSPYFNPRTFKLWGAVLKNTPPVTVNYDLTPDIEVDRQFAFELGGRKFEIISTPGGETLDGLSVWLPQERTVFTGNLFGPVFLSMPFLTTIRGDKPRSVLRYLRSLEKVRALGAELLITGHGDPIHGADVVRASLDKLHAAVSYINQATIDGMNAGKDVHTLMREISLPDHLKIGEFHGKVSWAVRAIWEEYSGWFHYDSTTSLFHVPRSSVNADLVELAGGADKLAARAKAKLDASQPLEALHLLDIALGAAPANRPALEVKKAALTLLLERSGGGNLSETMWLRSEIEAAAQALSAPS